ncbi:DUF1801 domain-containing protein [Fodinibius sediminis]|uniref:Uncharacterized protein n=1 Tax=Fodinibius sediminis TaxID=1214077 RepID=A0A521EKS6_9BACT|nr:DUF1801 domain-containing protein [Fodinibius sediminis]SMO84526.1 hypothetical protein SAMN06265218_11718 [Fodinibius sediminis]
MEELREIIPSTVPQAEEGISWKVPIRKYRGILAGFNFSCFYRTFCNNMAVKLPVFLGPAIFDNSSNNAH